MKFELPFKLIKEVHLEDCIKLFIKWEIIPNGITILTRFMNREINVDLKALESKVNDRKSQGLDVEFMDDHN